MRCYNCYDDIILQYLSTPFYLVYMMILIEPYHVPCEISNAQLMWGGSKSTMHYKLNLTPSNDWLYQLVYNLDITIWMCTLTHIIELRCAKKFYPVYTSLQCTIYFELYATGNDEVGSLGEWASDVVTG